MKLLILDTETTGLNPQREEIIEIAASLFHVESRSVLASLSTLITPQKTKNSAQHINKISDEALAATSAVVGSAALAMLKNMATECDYIVAHNAEFDRRFLEKYPSLNFGGKTWLCSMKDLSLGSAKKLTELALECGVPVTRVHRADSDVDLLCRIFENTSNLTELVREATQPKIIVEALVSFEDKDKAKIAGFTWDKERRGWFKEMPKGKYVAKHFDFDTQI